MLTKFNCNLFGGILCSSVLWVGSQRCEFRGISSAFLSVHHPSSQCRSGCRDTVKMKGLGDFRLLSCPVGFLGFLLVMVLEALCGQVPKPFLWGRMSLECRGPSLGPSPGWDDGQRCWFTSGHSVALLLWTPPLLPAAKWVRSCDRGSVNAKLYFWNNPSALKSSRNWVLCFTLQHNWKKTPNLCYVFILIFLLLVQHFQFKWQQTEAQNGKECSELCNWEKSLVFWFCVRVIQLNFVTVLWFHVQCSIASTEKLITE